MARVESRFFSSLPGARKIRPHLLLSPSVETNPSTESNSIGADPEPPLKVLATGHTHLPEIAMGRDGVHLVNCGSWKARARPRGSRRLILEQTLDAIVIRPLPEGRLDISLLQIDPSGREWTQPNQ